MTHAHTHSKRRMNSMARPELPAGLDFRVTHMRYFQHDELGHAIPEKTDPKGGITHVGIYRGNELVAEATATCAGSDDYDENFGRDLALDRAQQKLPSQP